jgi:NhaP-type Na+/H+ or K+/H+ antiporter
MEHVWHTLEYLGNTVIFILAGVIIGQSMIYNWVGGRVGG